MSAVVPATDTEIIKHTIRSFNLASDRGGGRKERSRCLSVLHFFSAILMFLQTEYLSF